MIDVFVKVWIESRLRAHLCGAVLERVMNYPEANVIALCASNQDVRFVLSNREARGIVEVEVLGPQAFWKHSKQWADSHATSDIYVVIDDDQLPLGRDWIANGVAAMLAHPNFAMLSAWSINGEVALSHSPADWGEMLHAFPTIHPEPVRSIGTPYFCRARSLGTLPDGDRGNYDQVMTDHVRTRGPVGFLYNVRHNHLGCGYSQVIPEHWGM